MSAIPPCGLACRIAKANTYLKEKKKEFLIYSVFYLLGIEILSMFIRYEKNYACFWYPLLTQVGFFLLVFSFYLWNEKLRFCLRKNIALLSLSSYYLIGIIALLFNFSDNFYYTITSYSFLGISIILLFLSILNKFK